MADLAESERTLSLLTCSMPSDFDLFALLVRSIDELVSPQITHRVVVPGSSVRMFKRFETPRREIIAQEDVLPVSLFALPRVLRYLSPLAAGLRRPLYVDARFRLVRGWILQQIIKIEMTRRAAEAAVMHVDSDVFFFRALEGSDVFIDGKPHFFRVVGATRNPRHREWIDTASRLLDLPGPADYSAHYIENCVLWSTAVLRRMVDRLESVQAAPIHDVLMPESTLSEYYLYGAFIDRLAREAAVSASEVPFCKSHWRKADTELYDLRKQFANFHPLQVALSIQSTDPLSPERRVELYEAARSPAWSEAP